MYREIDPEDKETAIEALELGILKPAEIARFANVSLATVHRWCKERGINPKERRRQYIRQYWHDMLIEAGLRPPGTKPNT